MSSFKKAQKAQRRTHKERSQPARRKKYGLLEKKGDWKKRSEDYHFKEKRLKALYEKARNRNPDEFYHAMAKAKTSGGVHVATRSSIEYSHDELKLLKSQDLNYLRSQLRTERNKIDRARESLPLLEADGEEADGDGLLHGKHTIFVDSRKKVARFDPAEHFETAPELVGRKFNRPRVRDLEAGPAFLGGGDRKSLKKIAKKRTAAFNELGQRIDRLKKIESVVDELETKKNLQSKGRKTVIKDKADPKKVTYRWKKERRK
mmetsp:Transcript_3277/g.8062  ORF Transcript_3277/g.8062 Transcript_3277/m.8062 type:complete len:261 (-) Transcript_3277:743-1525(-)